MTTQGDQVDRGEATAPPTITPADEGKPTIFVYLDADGEVQVGANVEFDLGEMSAMLDVAKAKIDLLGFRLLRKAQRQAEVRQTLLSGVR